MPTAEWPQDDMRLRTIPYDWAIPHCNQPSFGNAAFCQRWPTRPLLLVGTDKNKHTKTNPEAGQKCSPQSKAVAGDQQKCPPQYTAQNEAGHGRAPRDETKRPRRKRICGAEAQRQKRATEAGVAATTSTYY